MEKKAKMRTKFLTIKDNNGLATIEALPILVIFLVLISYGLGLFGVIHSGILYSIAARTYAFETFRNRANIVYHRDTAGSDLLVYDGFEIRYHAVKERKAGSQFYAAKRPLNFGDIDVFKPEDQNKSNVEVHNNGIFEISPNSPNPVGVSPVWLMIGYGMCVNSSCGGQN